MTTLFLILIGIIILMCIWLNNVSSRIGIPTLLAFIVLGILFGNNPRSIPVEILRGNTCIFSGFVEPNTYSQPFNRI